MKIIYKVSIIKKIVSLKDLDKQIFAFEINSSGLPAYLFMNEDTLKELAELNDTCNISEPPDKSHSCGVYNGHRIYINNYLDFGEVEIR